MQTAIRMTLHVIPCSINNLAEYHPGHIRFAHHDIWLWSGRVYLNESVKQPGRHKALIDHQQQMRVKIYKPSVRAGFPMNLLQRALHRAHAGRISNYLWGCVQSTPASDDRMAVPVPWFACHLTHGKGCDTEKPSSIMIATGMH